MIVFWVFVQGVCTAEIDTWLHHQSACFLFLPVICLPTCKRDSPMTSPCVHCPASLPPDWLFSGWRKSRPRPYTWRTRPVGQHRGNDWLTRSAGLAGTRGRGVVLSRQRVVGSMWGRQTDGGFDKKHTQLKRSSVTTNNEQDLCDFLFQPAWSLKMYCKETFTGRSKSVIYVYKIPSYQYLIL